MRWIRRVSGDVAGAEVEGGVGDVWGVCQGGGKGSFGCELLRLMLVLTCVLMGLGVAPLVGRALGRGG
jgi:hypothetical protein